MPKLSVWLVRAALVALVLGSAIGAVLLAGPGLGAPGVLRWRPLHAELLTVGWLLQLAFGVAWWILPRFRSGPERGREDFGWAALGLLDLGVLLAGTGGALGRADWALAGRGAQLLAAGAFILGAWPRVKPFR